MKRKSRNLQPVLTLLETRELLSFQTLNGFNALNNTGYYPSDAIVAVGPSHIVEAVNESIGIYNKSTQALISTETFATLFGNTFNTGGLYGMFDPQVEYDSTAGKFLITTQVNDIANGKAYVDFAESNSSDPTAGFTNKLQIEVDGGGLFWDDNGKLGYNADAFVYTGNAYNSSNNFDHEDIIIINASTLSYNIVPLNGGPASIIPAQMQNSVAGSPMWFVQTSYNGGNTVNVDEMTNLLNNPNFFTTSLSVNSYTNLGVATQPGGVISTSDSRTTNVVWNNNEMVAGFNSAVGSDDAAAWIEINTGGSSPTVNQQGVIHPANGVNTYFPAITINANNNVFITYNESSSTEYMSMYVAERSPSDPLGTMETPVEIQAGNTTLSPGRAGDYNGVSLDPSDPTFCWGVAEYASSNYAASWGTYIVEFGGLTAPPPPPQTPPTLAFISNVTMNSYPATANVTLNGSDPDGDALTYSAVLQNSIIPVQLTVNGNILQISPKKGFYGTFNIIATVNDGFSSVSQTFSVTVKPPKHGKGWRIFNASLEKVLFYFTGVTNYHVFDYYQHGGKTP